MQTYNSLFALVNTVRQCIQLYTKPPTTRHALGPQVAAALLRVLLPPPPLLLLLLPGSTIGVVLGQAAAAASVAVPQQHCRMAGWTTYVYMKSQLRVAGCWQPSSTSGIPMTTGQIVEIATTSHCRGTADLDSPIIFWATQYVQDVKSTLDSTK